MRKDVRFGLTIGAILLAVLVVYVLVVPGDPGPEQVTLETIDSPAAGGEAGDVDPSVLNLGTTEAAASPGPGEMAVIPPAASTPSDAGSSTSTPAEVMAPPGEWDWEGIFNTGSMMAATREQGPGAAGMDTARVSPAPSPAPVQARISPQPFGTSGVESTTYTVQPGDSFSNIAQRLYGDARHYLAIEQANPGVDSRRLKVGQTINVPARESVVRESAVQAAAQQGGADETPVDASRQYRVEANDSLYKIAQKLYGDGNKWQALHETNRQAIGENPANLKVGQVLTLPEAPTQSAAR